VPHYYVAERYSWNATVALRDYHSRVKQQQTTGLRHICLYRECNKWISGIPPAFTAC
jgi:hypothetical protein